jgi:DNA mismatch endonuclease (patch repair protein)
VHGCFWHGHDGCKVAHIPKTRPEYWEAKFDRNRERDRRHLLEAEGLGWDVLVIWECEAGDTAALIHRLKSFLGPPKHL